MIFQILQHLLDIDRQDVFDCPALTNIQQLGQSLHQQGIVTFDRNLLEQHASAFLDLQHQSLRRIGRSNPCEIPALPLIFLQQFLDCRSQFGSGVAARRDRPLNIFSR